MKSLILKCCVSVVILIISLPVFAQTSLWQISKGDKILYLGGTIHILGEEDYPLPEEFQYAFQKSKKIVFETDIAKAKEPEFSQKMMQQMIYPAGETLKDSLSESTYQRLEKYFSDKMVPMEKIDIMKPGMVSIMLSVMEFQRMGMVSVGVDEHFWQLAKQDGKTIGFLESLDEQLSFLVNMGIGNENELILNTLNDLKDVTSMINSLRAAWRSGNELEMKKIVLQSMIDDYPKLYQNMLVVRNNNWLPHIEEMIEDEAETLVLVGALHLVGDDGLLQLLRNKGYEVEHYLL
ncbi:MAG: TraB/GumN family protein [Gammaproteobacteria bacterium]|nr:TraB/GumN family protein [Gammaproteobacteria bacterium]